MGALVDPQPTDPRVALAAGLAEVRLLSSVREVVTLEVALGHKRLPARLACEGSFPSLRVFIIERTWVRR